MDTFFFYLALVTLIIIASATIELLWGSRKIRALSQVNLPEHPPSTKVSLIFAARNEQRNLEKALNSYLNQDYPDLEIIAVDDRSTDQTADILDRMAADQSQLHVHHLSELPDGWLGKNHALHFAAQKATGDLLLFTDADIIMHPQTLSRAVQLLGQNNIDHLPIAPVPTVKPLLLQMFVGTFLYYFTFFTRPWWVPSPRSKMFIGIGAFNMIRKEVYEKIGTHRAIALRPDDDMKLGKLVKIHGFKSELAYGRDFLTVEWYSSLRQLIDGLMKNAFAGSDYSIWLTIASCFALFAWAIAPFAAVWFTSGATRWLNVSLIALLLIGYMDLAHQHHQKRWHALALPLTTLIFIYILARSMLLILVRGGLTWRDTFYPLADLKANKI